MPICLQKILNAPFIAGMILVPGNEFLAAFSDMVDKQAADCH
jgi:hypothetical protein